MTISKEHWGKFKRQVEQEMVSVQELEVAELTDQESLSYTIINNNLLEEVNND